MKVAAVIPHWNRRDLLEILLPNLQAQTRLFDEIIVVDNGSSDDSAAFAESKGARVVRLEKNLGFAAAVNRGIESARDADWIAILNNDIVLTANWLENMLHGAGDVFFASGKILRASDPSIIDGAFDEISRGACAYRCGEGKKDSEFWNQPRRIRIAPMTAALFRSELLKRIGPLDEKFGSYLEDVDYGIRCSLAGYEGVYVPSAVSRHRGSATWGPWNRDTVKQIARNQVLLCFKYFQGQPRLPILAGQMLWGVVAFRHLRGLSYFAGKIAGWKTARATYRERIGETRERIGETEDRLTLLAQNSEREILALQRQTGFDWYWRAYFWLLSQR